MDMIIIPIQAVEGNVSGKVTNDFLHHRPDLCDTIVNKLPWRSRTFSPQHSYRFREYILRRMKNKHVP
ncbi:hypothetical protein CHAD_08825 [Corynebacterium hadale]|nr:hypothetical protein CHAD_08825 [Corynebacterium hadale]